MTNKTMNGAGDSSTTAREAPGFVMFAVHRKIFHKITHSIFIFKKIFY